MVIVANISISVVRFRIQFLLDARFLFLQVFDLQNQAFVSSLQLFIQFFNVLFFKLQILITIIQLLVLHFKLVYFLLLIFHVDQRILLEQIQGMLVLVDKWLDFGELAVELTVFVDENLGLFIVSFPFFLERSDLSDELAVGGSQTIADFLKFVYLELEYDFLFGLELVIEELVDFVVIYVMVAVGIILFLLWMMGILEGLIFLPVLDVDVALLRVHGGCWWFKYY